MTDDNGIRRAIESMKATTEALAEASQAVFARPVLGTAALKVGIARHEQAMKAAAEASKAAFARPVLGAAALKVATARNEQAMKVVAEASRAAFVRPMFDAGALNATITRSIFDIHAERSKAIRESLVDLARLSEAVTPDLDYPRTFRDFDFEPTNLPPMCDEIDELHHENAELRQEVADLRRRVSGLELREVGPLGESDFVH